MWLHCLFFVGRTCRGTEADVIRDIPIEVEPQCLRCKCNACSAVIEAALKHIKGDVDFWFRHIVALYGNWWIPSMGNMRAFHVVVSLSANDVRRAELATLFLQADHVQKRKRWLAKRVLDQWFRFVAWRRRAWIRATFVHRVSFEWLTIIGAMVFAPPRRLIFRH